MLIQSNQENQKSLSLAQVCSLQNGSNIESLTEVPTLPLSLRKFQLYFSPFFHYSIPKYLSEDIEQIQRRALSIIYPDLNYKDALTESGEITLYERRERASQKFFQRILDDPCHKLYNLISKVDPASSYNFRHKRLINIPHFKTERFKNTFLVASSLMASN